MAVFAADRPFFGFDMAPFTGFVSPVFTKLSDFTRSFGMALFAVLFHEFLVFFVREGNLAH